MAAHAKRIEVVAEDRPVLERWAGARATERRLVDRARIVLMAGEGRPASEIAQRVGCSLPTVKTWRAHKSRLIPRRARRPVEFSSRAPPTATGTDSSSVPPHVGHREA
jgi:DNA-directed RNA polymerase specialized sigma24 family protein